uniref:Uncharacterized protein n=1 Tax=Acrobeloides nanus TaxID=290746 RepID=A0A914DZJ3_9BILA
MGDRYMPSIFSECNALKQNYDKCFTTFFQKYINPEYRHKAANNPCEDLHTAYRECVEKHIELYKPYDVEIEELRKEVSQKLEDARSRTD